MLRRVKLAALGLLRGSGIFSLVTNSHWRQQRLLILCYHGTSLEDEHLWRPSLYIDPQKLEQRLESLKKGYFSVVPLGEALRRLGAGTLPPRSVALTFDDGTYDFFRQAYPLLRDYGFPVTVYQTTYYTSVDRPVFNLICSYMLWTRRGEVIADGEGVGLKGPLDLRTHSGRSKVMGGLIEISERDRRTGLQKDEIAAQLARVLKIDYDNLRAKRILQLMNGRELQEIARNGVDVQLHTHRHRTPEDEGLFRKEIKDNRSRIHELTATQPVHFCYPSGIYRPSFLPWLREEHVVSATTCDTGLAARQSEILLLPRFIDNQNCTQIEFESWVTGVGELLALRRTAIPKYLPGGS
jgi:peptidoglycan/xylan/chitin deacetylase (PgdA/CDA1 family)